MAAGRRTRPADYLGCVGLDSWDKGSKKPSVHAGYSQYCGLPFFARVQACLGGTAALVLWLDSDSRLLRSRRCYCASGLLAWLLVLRIAE